MRRLLLLALLAWSGWAFGQGTATFQRIVITDSLGRPLGGVSTEICNTTASQTPACVSPATIYSDVALAHPIPCTGPTTCLTTDALGQIPTFFAAPGYYCYVATAPYISDTSCKLVVLYAASGTTIPSLGIPGQQLTVNAAATGAAWQSKVVLDARDYSTVAATLAACGSSTCPFSLSYLFADTTLFSPLAANAFLFDYRKPPGKYGPMFVVGDLPPSNGNPTGYPPQGSFDTGIDLNYTLQASSRQFNLTGTTISGNNAIHYDFASLAGNPASGSGARQITGFYRGLETSSTVGDLANVADIKLDNSYLSLRAPSFAGVMAGKEDDIFYRAAGTISKIDYAHLSVAGVPDAIAANITGASYVEPVELDIKGSGSHGNWIMKDLRPVISMATGGTLTGLTGYCFACIQTITTTGTVTQNIYGFQKQGPATLPTFSASKYWFASINNAGSATGANVNNDWWSGGDWNSGHLTFGGDGGATAAHLWRSGSDGFLHFLNGSAPASSTDGSYLLTGTSIQTLTYKTLASPINGVTTDGNSIPLIVKVLDLATQSDNIGATTLYGVPSAGAGMYRASCYAVVTTADLVSSALPGCNVAFTDADTNVVITTPLTVALNGNTVGVTNSSSTTAGRGSPILNAKASTNIQYSTTSYASNTPNAMKYSLHIKLEYLGP